MAGTSGGTHGNYGKRQKLDPPVFQYFKVNENDSAQMICQVQEDEKGDSESAAGQQICGRIITVVAAGKKDAGTATGNLLRHLKRAHPNEAEIVVTLNEKQSKLLPPPVKRRPAQVKKIN